MLFKNTEKKYIVIIMIFVSVLSIFQSRLCYAGLSSTMEVYIAAVVIDKPASNEKCVLPSVKINAREKVADDPKTINWAITTNSYLNLTSSMSNEEKVFNITLPGENNKFGNNTIRERATARGTNYDATAGVKFFFDKTATNHPGGGTPNWYYYWKQTSASSGSHRYNPSLGCDGQYTTGQSYFEIGPSASGPDYGFYPDGEGIDNFGSTCLHEKKHMDYFLQAWGTWANYLAKKPAEDKDNDVLKDIDDAALGYDSTEKGTPTNAYCTNDDYEDLACRAEASWNIGSAKSEDWAKPGKQY